MIIAAILVILIPAIVIAKSGTKTQTNKNEKQIAENIKKIIEPEKVVVPKMPIGEFPKPEPPKPVSQPVSNISAKMFIYYHESGNNPSSVNRNSGACGLGQALPCSKMGCSLGDYACQDAWFTRYMQARYGTWENARNFWLSHHYW